MPDQFKNALRNTIKQVRSKISTTYKATSSSQICTRIQSLEQYKKAQRIGFYWSINGEIDLSSLWNNATVDGKLCFFPALNDDLTLSFLPVTPTTTFINNKFEIPEPSVSRDLAVPIDQLDLIIIPLLAFDIRCNRIGMGAGYYDRTLINKRNSLIIGVGYQFQRVEFLEAQSWDIPLDAVITQKAIYWRQP